MDVGGNSIIISLASLLRLGLTIYMYMVIARALISWVNPNPYNKAVQFLAKVTDPVLIQIRRLIPFNVRGLDFSPVILILLIVFVNDFLVGTLVAMASGSGISSIGPFFLVSFIRLVRSLIWAYIVILIIRLILSLISPDPYNIIVQFIYTITEPVLYPLRRSLPLVFGGFDFTPVALIAVLYLIADPLLLRLMLTVAESGMMTR